MTANKPSISKTVTLSIGSTDARIAAMFEQVMIECPHPFERVDMNGMRDPTGTFWRLRDEADAGRA